MSFATVYEEFNSVIILGLITILCFFIVLEIIYFIQNQRVKFFDFFYSFNKYIFNS